MSDDKLWAKKNLHKDRDVILSSSLAKNKIQATGEDLALLSLCDHMIMTRGTFSMWAARMSGIVGHGIFLTADMPF